MSSRPPTIASRPTTPLRRVCVFCAHNPGNDPRYVETARATGAFLAERRIGLVYGGGNHGMMGALANGALEAGGEVIGVIPRALVEREVAHTGVTELRVVRSMHERKQLMHELSDGLIALPGGLGTFEELLESLTWSQLGLHGKPCAALNVAGYYDPLLDLLARAVLDGLLRAENRALLIVDDDLGRLYERMLTWRSPVEEIWIDEEQT